MGSIILIQSVCGNQLAEKLCRVNIFLNVQFLLSKFLQMAVFSSMTHLHTSECTADS